VGLCLLKEQTITLNLEQKSDQPNSKILTIWHNGMINDLRKKTI
jgi:hypothetical protein